MEKKPNQIIDEISNVIYPPAEAVVNQLSTIRAIIPSTIKMYESTGDIHTIQPNLDMIQRAIDYLRGAPMRDELKPTPEDTMKIVYKVTSPGVAINFALDGDEYVVNVEGIDIARGEIDTGLFGKIDFDATQMSITIPVICGHTYRVCQVNPVLEYYKDDPSVYKVGDVWEKEKEYTLTEDTFEYCFLLAEGRTKVGITISDVTDPDSFTTSFCINSHIHFKKQELPEEPPAIEESETEEGERR